MTVTYVNSQKNKTVMSSSVTNYVLPDSGNIMVKDIEAPLLYINGNAFDVINKKMSIPVCQENIELEVDGERFSIIVLCQEYKDETKFDYNYFGNSFHNNLIDGKMGEFELFTALEDDDEDLKLPLCTFNRKFESITKDIDVNKVLECVEKFPHIFQKPKQHLKQVNEIRPASVVSRIGQESISHLASHSEHWKGIKVGGLIPERLLARTLEDDFAIYENVAVKTLADELYNEMKKLNEENVDCHMQMELDDGHAVSAEQKSYYHARDILLKGMDDDEVIEQQILLEDQKKAIDMILQKLGKCRSTPLYRSLKKVKPIRGKLKKTNIFMMDKYYKEAYRLSEILRDRQEVSPYDTTQEVRGEYALYCKVLFIFALRYFNFEPDSTEPDLFNEEQLIKTDYHFKKWRLSIEEQFVNRLNIGGFSMRVFMEKPINVFYGSIDIPESIISRYEDISLEGEKLIFKHTLNDSEQESLINDLKKAWPSNKKKVWAAEFKANMYAAFQNINLEEKKVLFVPWKYILPDNVEEIRQLMRMLKDMVDTDGYDKVFLLTASRPNELSHVDDLTVLNKLISYGVADWANGLKEEKYGIIPIGIGDINSYRRYTKIILRNMVEVDHDREYCPICGDNLTKGRGGESNIATCNNRDCGFTLIDTVCSNEDCKTRYTFSRYRLPKTTNVDMDNQGFKVIAKENRLGFKNLTVAQIEGDQINPVCPCCGR